MDSSLEFLEKLGTFDKQLSSVLRALRSDIIFLREELAAKHTDIKTLKSDIEIRNNTIADLQARLAERQAVEETNEEVVPEPAPGNPLQPIEEANEEANEEVVPTIEEVVPTIEMAEVSSPKVAESIEETNKEVVTEAPVAAVATVATEEPVAAPVSSEEPTATASVASVASVTPVTSKCKFFCF